MKYVYVSPALPNSVFGKLLGYGKGSPGQQAQKYNKLLAKGISLCGSQVLMLSAPPVPPGSRLFKLIKTDPESENGLEFRFLNVLDLPVIKNLYTYFQSKKEIKRIASESTDDICVVCDLLTLSASLGALTAAKKLGVKTCGIVTDLPGYLEGRPSTGSYGKTYKKAADLCGSFVLLTSQMARPLGTGDRPFVVIEGISTPLSGKDETVAEYDGRPFVFYAGGIEKAYGVEKLVKAFIDADLPDFDLVLCGAGKYADELENTAAAAKNVKYFGVIANEKVMELEKQATLLVNPRTSEGEFTAYSFPSKNIEYMSTGTPMMAYMLPGIPEEYREHMIVPENESAEVLGEALKKALSEDPQILKNKGIKAREFALTKKSPEAQAARLIEMIENTRVKN